MHVPKTNFPCICHVDVARYVRIAPRKRNPVGYRSISMIRRFISSEDIFCLRLCLNTKFMLFLVDSFIYDLKVRLIKEIIKMHSKDRLGLS